jgi:polysaccharide export outer membrane protein
MKFYLRQYVIIRFSAICLALLASSGYLSQANSQNSDNKPVSSIKAESDRNLPLGEKQASTTELQAQGTGAFDMSAVERLRLRVLDYTDFNSEYTIDSDLTLSLPGVGRIDVRGVSLSKMEEVLGKRISLFARRDLKVSMEIVRFRPYFIMGMIARPGADEWKPRTNVIKAIALAGGTVRQPSAGDDPVAALAIQQSRTQLQFSLALLARLKAERDGSAKVENDESLNAVIARMPASIQPRLKEFATRQSAILDEQRQLTIGQINGLEQERETARNELEAAQKQEIAIKGQLDISQSLLKDIEQLKNQKLVSNSRYLEQRSDLMSSQIRHAEAQSLTERARARVEAVTRQIATLKRQHRVALNDRIETLQREVAQLEVSLLPSGFTSASSSAGSTSQNLVYYIARETDSGIATFNATVFSEIIPGDVIVVSTGAQDEVSLSGNQMVPNSNTADAAGRIQKAIESSSSTQGGGATRSTRGSVIR